jgi:hypothetical protein
MQSAQDAVARLNGAPTTTGQYVSEPTVKPQSITPVYAPQVAPNQPAGELTFPATARGPAPNSSSYVAPGYNYPSMQLAPQGVASTAQTYQPVPQAPGQPMQVPQRPAYQTATAPRYLPPVQQSPGATMVR